MEVWLPTILVSISVVSTLGLGLLVLARTSSKWTHRIFAACCLNLALWAIGVILVIQSATEEQAITWLRVTFAVAAFLPAIFYTFTAVFPRQRFEGSRVICAFLWSCSVALAVAAFTPWHAVSVELRSGLPPAVQYSGPVFGLFSVSLVVVFAGSITNLLRKLIGASGLERRQIQHVLMALVASMSLAVLSNVLAPLLRIQASEPYGPAFASLMMAWFAYAMVRYHLLDVWFIISRTTVYALTTTFVASTFFATISLMHWQTSAGDQRFDVATSLIVGLFIAAILQPLRDRIQLSLDRMVLHRRYDMQALMARISQNAADVVKLDQLLETVSKDIVWVMGVKPVRILLVDEKNPNALVVAFSTKEGDQSSDAFDAEALLTYMRDRGKAAILEQIIHRQPTRTEARVARDLAEMDAFLCVPLRTSSGLVGLLTLGRKTTGDIYTYDDTVAFTTVAAPLATAIQNARLYHKLEEANIHRARILGTMRGALISADADGCVALVNRSATELLGPIEVGHSIDTLMPEVAVVLQQTLQEQRAIQDFEAVIQRPDGDAAHVVMSSSCLKTTNDELSGAMVMVYDLTQIKRLEQNVKRADRLSSLGTLAAGMAHEIKNPLVSIKTFTQLLPERHDDPEFVSTFSDIVPHEVDRIDSIVSRLLDFARPRVASQGPADLAAVLRKVHALVVNQAEKAGVALEHDWPSEPLLVRGDEQQLTQVFLNLLLNALEAVPCDVPGRVEIVASMESLPLRREGMAPLFGVECASVTVRDSGPGILPDHLDYLFTPFFTTKEDGSGLGLSVVHGIVNEHGGAIDVSNTANGGAEFTVTLPLAPKVVHAENAK
jgi:PAS domain S-box-containing protein